MLKNSKQSKNDHLLLDKMKIIVILIVATLKACHGNEEPRRYGMNIECGGLTHEQCVAKAEDTFKEYCQTSDDKVCKGYRIFDYDKAAELDIDLSTVSECIDNDGSLTKCKCGEKIVDLVTKQKTIICRDINNPNKELTPSTSAITGEKTNEQLTSTVPAYTSVTSSYFTSEQRTITSSKTTKTDIKNANNELTTLHTPSAATTAGVRTAEEKTSTALSTVPTETTITNSYSTYEQNTIALSETTEADTTNTNNKQASSHTPSTTAFSGETNEQMTSTALKTVTDYYFSYERNTISLSETPEDDYLREQGWSKAPNEVYYKLFTYEVTYAEAKSHCEEQNAILASKVIREEYSEILRAMESHEVNEVWVGLTDIETEGTWVWEDGVASDSTVPWGVRPIGGNSQNCAFLPIKKRGAMYDLSCTFTLSFVCEKNV